MYRLFHRWGKELLGHRIMVCIVAVAVACDAPHPTGRATSLTADGLESERMAA